LSDASDERVVRKVAQVLGSQARRSRGIALGRECEDRHRVPVAPWE
jgi:hypothetical protein